MIHSVRTGSSGCDGSHGAASTGSTWICSSPPPAGPLVPSLLHQWSCLMLLSCQKPVARERKPPLTRSSSAPGVCPAGSHTRGKAVQFSYLEMLLVDEYHGITLGSRTSSHLHISSQEVLMNRAGKKNVLAKKPFCHLLECCSALIVNKETSKRSHFSSSSQKC